MGSDAQMLSMTNWNRDWHSIERLVMLIGFVYYCDSMTMKQEVEVRHRHRCVVTKVPLSVMEFGVNEVQFISRWSVNVPSRSSLHLGQAYVLFFIETKMKNSLREWFL